MDCGKYLKINVEKNLDSMLIIDLVSEKINIQKERLKMDDIINLNFNHEIKLECEKIYLFYFDDTTNIGLKIDNIGINNLSNGLLFNNDNSLITIEGCANSYNKVFIISDILNECDTIDEINELSKYKPSNGIFIYDCADSGLGLDLNSVENEKLENDKIITNELCNELINCINEIDKPNIEKWGINSNVNCKYIDISTSKCDEIKNKFDTQLFKIISWVIKKLKTDHNISCSGDSGYCLRKIYGPTRLHKDGINVGTISGKYLPIRKIRNMSVIMCLNDDYDGGEFYFPRQDFKIKLKKGQIIAFPPYWTHPHMVSAPINGTYRYTINTWLFE